MEQLRLPWEAIERVIDYSGHHQKALSSFSLTCRQLRPRSLYVRFDQVEFRSRDHVLGFVNLLRDNPSLDLYVRSIVVQPNVLSSFPLLHVLPRLPAIVFRQPHGHAGSDSFPAIYQSSLTYFRRFGAHIQNLLLSDLSFETTLPFVRLLLAFPKMMHLNCTDITFQSWGDREHLDLFKQRLTKQMRLKTLTINIFSRPKTPSMSVVVLLSDLGSVLLTVKILRIMHATGGFAFPMGFKWPHLRLQRLELSFRFPRYSSQLFISGTVELLKMFRSPTLEEVSVKVDLSSINQGLFIADIFKDLGRPELPGPQIYDALERSLFKFSWPQLLWTIRGPLRLGKDTFWARQIARQFPSLSQRGTVTLNTSLWPATSAGHSAFIYALVVSPDGNWVASGSNDSTVILWDVDGRIVQQWVTHGGASVQSLAFSPDSQYLLLGGSGQKMVLRDLHQDTENIITFEGQELDGAVESCAWHPNGEVIVSGSMDGSVQLWDTRTFQHLGIFGQHSEGVLRVTFCSEGRILGSTTSTGEFSVWDVLSGTLQASIPGPPRRGYTEIFKIPAFDPGSMRLATWSARAAAEIWDARTGTVQFLLGQEDGMTYESGSFSPDGKLLATELTSGTVKIWDSHTGAHSYSLGGYPADTKEMYFSPCGKYFAHVSKFRQPALRLWRISDWSRVTTLSEDRRPVTHIAFSPDGKTLWSGAADGTVIFKRMQDILAPQKHL